MDNQPTPSEFARELLRRGLAPMVLDADVESMILADVGKHFSVVDEDVMAFAV